MKPTAPQAHAQRDGPPVVVPAGRHLRSAPARDGMPSAADCLLGFALGLIPVTVLELVKLARAAVGPPTHKELAHALRV